jgi:hypothetical protein
MLVSKDDESGGGRQETGKMPVRGNPVDDLGGCVSYALRRGAAAPVPRYATTVFDAKGYA